MRKPSASGNNKELHVLEERFWRALSDAVSIAVPEAGTAMIAGVIWQLRKTHERAVRARLIESTGLHPAVPLAPPAPNVPLKVWQERRLVEKALEDRGIFNLVWRYDKLGLAERSGDVSPPPPEVASWGSLIPVPMEGEELRLSPDGSRYFRRFGDLSERRIGVRGWLIERVDKVVPEAMLRPFLSVGGERLTRPA